MAELNPLRQVYTATWTMLEAYSGWTALVPSADRIKLDDATLTGKIDIYERAITPRAVFAAVEFQPHLQHSSTHSDLNVIWELQLHTGSHFVNNYHDLIWETYRALQGWATHMKTLTWNGTGFIDPARPLKVESERGGNPEDNARQSPTHRIWRAVWRGETRMHFLTSDIAPS